MINYCTIAQLDSSGQRLATMLHQLANTNVGDLYIYVDSKDNKALRADGGFLKVPKNKIQQMEIQACAGATYFEIEVKHLTIKKKVGSWEQHIEDFEFQESINDSELVEFADYKKYMPAYYEDLTPLERFRASKTTRTKKIICAKQMFVKADSLFVQNIMQVAASSNLKNLSEDHRKHIESLISIVGIDRIKNLSLILDPKWEHYATELNIAIELQEKILIRGEGVKGHKFKARMIAYLHKQYLNINPSPYEPDAKFNAKTDRLCTIANPDKAK